MTTDWTLLEPSYAALCACFVRDEPTDSTSEIQVSYEWRTNCGVQRELFLTITLETEIKENVLKLIQIQEAIDLFAALSIVDNKMFRERFRHVTQSRRRNDRRWYPRWRLLVRGSASVHQATWSSLFAFPDTSPRFQRAMQILNGVGLNDTYKQYPPHNYCVKWACKFDGADVDIHALLVFDNNVMFNWINTGVQRLFQAGVLLFKQLGLTGDATIPVDLLPNQSVSDDDQMPMDITLSITIRQITPIYSQVLAGLTLLPVCHLEMTFSEENATIRMKTEVLLNQVDPENGSDFTMACDKLSRNIFPAIYSIQAMRSDTRPTWITVGTVDSESWPLLMDVICCGPSIGISLNVKNAILTNADLLKIADVTAPWCCQNRQVSSEFHTLEMRFIDTESGSLAVNLLGSIGRNLRFLTLFVEYSDNVTLDLSELSAVCPNLEYLHTYRIHVVVSAHTKSLAMWPIQELISDSYSKLSDIILCLRNPNLRMKYELKTIDIMEFGDHKFKEEHKRELLLHHGEFLSVRQEKVPLWSKAAMVSVVNCVRPTSAIHRLHEDILRLVFAFASTPAMRSVQFWEDEDR